MKFLLDLLSFVMITMGIQILAAPHNWVFDFVSCVMIVYGIDIRANLVLK